jgi:hypothetical protein
LSASSAWLWANRKARAHAIVPSDVRVASLVPRDTSLPGGALFAGGPFAILLISAVLVLTHWNELPEAARYAQSVRPARDGCHSGRDDVDDGGVVGAADTPGVRGRYGGAAEQKFRRINVFVIVLVGYGMGNHAVGGDTVAVYRRLAKRSAKGSAFCCCR